MSAHTGTDGPAGDGGARRLRALNLPTPVRVHTDERGWPIRVRLEGRSRSVAHVRESWRIDDEWWRRPVSRWYLTLVLDDGALVTVYRNLTGGGWYLQGG